MSKDLDFKTLVADMWKKVRSTPEGEVAYQKQKKLEEESTQRFFEQIKKKGRKNNGPNGFGNNDRNRDRYSSWGCGDNYNNFIWNWCDLV